MTSLAIKNNDIYLDTRNNLSLVNGIHEIKQSIESNIKSIDFITLFQTRFDVDTLSAVVKQKIIETKGVISLSKFNLSYKGIGTDCNSFRYSFIAYTDFGIISSDGE